MTTVGDVVAQLERWYDPAWAEPWDTVGLFSGDPGRTVGAVHVAVDPTEPVALEAAAHGAGLLVTHHPLFLGGATSVARTGPKGRTLALLDALYVAHTNADVADPGVSDALAAALGVTGLVPLQPQDDPLDRRAARPSTRGLGRIGTLPESLALQDFCGYVADRLPRT
ncbi:MAG: Nif3-like dinuclear metal center hexameric protein, partial [Nocardioidaceae bacterium]